MSRISRRQFIGAAGASLAAAPTILAQEKQPGANDKIAVALIGCGGRGNYNLGDFAKVPDFEIAALCDTDPSHIGNAMKIVEKAGRPTQHVKTYEDYRKLIDERKDLDAVIIATPDHHHAYALIHACLAGKAGKGLDVYCEKPISHNIVEGRAMVNDVTEHQGICQI